MSKIESHITHLTKEQIEQYLRGDLSDKEMHVIERHLLSCDMCNEAMEGYESSVQNIQFDAELDELSNRLESRINSKKKNKAFPFLRIAAIALVLIISGIFITNYFINDLKKPQFSEKKQKQLTDSSKVKEPKLEDNSKKEIESTEVKEEIESHVGKEEVESEIEQEKSSKKTDDSIVIPTTTSLSDNNNRGFATTQNIQNTNTSNDVTVEEIEITSYEVPLADQDAVIMDEIIIQESAKREQVIVQSRSMNNASSTKVATFAEEKNTVKGVVNDEGTNESLPFVSVVNIDRDVGTQTDLDGKFELEAEEGDEIVVSSIGYNTESIEIADEQELTVAMSAGVELDEYVVSDKSDYSISESDAQPSVGYGPYKQYLKDKMKFPQAAIDAEIKGKVIVKFRIDEKGSMSDFTITKSLGYGCDEEAIRLIKEGPSWHTAFRDGHAISQEVKVKVFFK